MVEIINLLAPYITQIVTAGVTTLLAGIVRYVELKKLKKK